MLKSYNAYNISCIARDVFPNKNKSTFMMDANEKKSETMGMEGRQI